MKKKTKSRARPKLKNNDTTIIKLNALDRLLCRDLLPKQSSIIEQMLARDIQEKIKMTTKDRANMTMSPNKDGEGIDYVIKNINKTEREISFTKPELQLLQTQVSKLDEQKNISLEMLDICLKIRSVSTTKETDK